MKLLSANAIQFAQGGSTHQITVFNFETHSAGCRRFTTT